MPESTTIADPGSFREYIAHVVRDFTTELVTVSPPGSIDADLIGEMLEAHMLDLARQFASADSDDYG